MIKLKCVYEKDNNNKDLICAICKDFLYPEKTMQLDCCHMYCLDCIRQINGSSIYGLVECPLCKIKSKPKNIKTYNRFAYNYLSSVEIYCPNENCNLKLEDGQLKKHLNRCDYQLIKCNYCDKDEIIRKDFKIHVMENLEDHFIQLMKDVEELKNNIF